MLSSTTVLESALDWKYGTNKIEEREMRTMTDVENITADS